MIQYLVAEAVHLADEHCHTVPFCHLVIREVLIVVVDAVQRYR